jgi:hypothetical protein
MPKAIIYFIPVPPSALDNLSAGDIADLLGSLKPEMPGEPETFGDVAERVVGVANP